MESSWVEIRLGAGTNITSNDSTFVFDGSITVQSEGKDVRMEEAYFCAYDENKELVGSRAIGPLYPGLEGESEFSLRIDDQVKYIIVDHPKLNKFETVSPLRLVYVERSGGFTSIAGENVSFDYSVPEMKDGCPEQV